ncbi:FlgO family outer membrane protein [Rheinheimera sp. 1928-s]|uniref:FlgO family outer membrane protein n=1 Tax=Rheinheimera sp. 1928-s TaxID=3033803 RepID=UPI00261830A5|nr:FlgO family outer membrane protein [Rheinheimera sp. 1928-s]MDF3125869.1 FlgO family outer membrane protein [Rheinheimera sp. 1928-s]
MNSLNSTMASESAKALLIAAVLCLSGCAASSTGSTEVTPSSSATADSHQMADEGFTESSVVVSSSTELCKCDSDSSSESSHTQSATTQNRDTEWFGLTQPFQEAEPAMGMTQQSQLDSAAVNNGQPIPGLRVKQFSRRTLPSELAVAAADPQLYNSAPQFIQSRKSLSDYVAQLAFKLAGNQQLQGAKVGVASFVLFDSQLEHTSTIGNQLAEELSTVLPGYGAAVIEYKLTKNITVGPTGDLSLSRTTSKLRNPQGIDYVLTGTMTPTRRGLQITSRVVSTRNNVVISSASTLIPALVLQQL